MIRIDISNRQRLLPLDRRRLRRAVAAILREAGVAQAEVSVAVLDDAAIRPIHARYLGQDHATDVLSFLYHRRDGSLDGEVVVSAETAQRWAARRGRPPDDELLRYVVHGTLHLVGWDDGSADARAAMRRRERAVLAQVRPAVLPRRCSGGCRPATPPRRCCQGGKRSP